MNQLAITSAQTMSSREMADLTEKRHDNVKRTIETLAEQGVISHPQIEDGKKAANGVVERVYLMGKRDSLVVVAQLCPEFTARIVDRWQELEAQVAAPALPNFLDPVAAARAWADEAEKAITYRRQAEEAIDIAQEAIRTKALIGSKREATAMATAARESRARKQLEIELDRSCEWATIKKMEAIYGRKFSWHLLKKTSEAHGMEVHKVQDENYPAGVNSYHQSIWMAVYKLPVSI